MPPYSSVTTPTRIRPPAGSGESSSWFAVLEAVFILGMSFLLNVPWMPFVALVSLPIFIWGLLELRKANAAEAPR